MSPSIGQVTSAELRVAEELAAIARDVRGVERSDFDKAFALHGWTLMTVSMSREDVTQPHATMRLQGLTSLRGEFDLLAFHEQSFSEDIINGVVERHVALQWWRFEPRGPHA